MVRPLSDKERRVIELYALGLTTQSVAYRMSVAESTVKTYARRAYKKLGVGSRAEGGGGARPPERCNRLRCWAVPASVAPASRWSRLTLSNEIDGDTVDLIRQ